MLLKQHVKLKSITDITPKLLKKIGVDTLFLDVDNTMCIHKGEKTAEGLFEWIKSMQSADIKLIILSNAKPGRLKNFACKVDLPFVALGAKPLPFGFFAAAIKAKSKLKNSAIVGDQLFTDILGGHLALCKTILLSPIELETSRGFVFKRKLERKVLKLLKIESDF